jgi:hypothetical protein
MTFVPALAKAMSPPSSPLDVNARCCASGIRRGADQEGHARLAALSTT